MTEEPAVALRARNKVGLWASGGCVTTWALATFAGMLFSTIISLVAFITPVDHANKPLDAVDDVKVALEKQQVENFLSRLSCVRISIICAA